MGRRSRPGSLRPVSGNSGMDNGNTSISTGLPCRNPKSSPPRLYSAVQVLLQQVNRLFLGGRLVGVKIADRDQPQEAPVAIHHRQVTYAAIFHGAAALF